MSAASHWFRKVFRGRRDKPGRISAKLFSGVTTLAGAANGFQRGVQIVVKRSKR